MRCVILTVLAVFCGCSGPKAVEAPPPAKVAPVEAPTPTAASTTASTPAVPSKADSKAPKPSTIEPWTAEKQESLLAQRLDGGMGHSFRQFANLFLVNSRLHLGCGVGLMTSSGEISESELQSPFPQTYQPTLRELLDAIALQTFSEWKYDPSSKYFKSDVPDEPAVKDVAIFEFTPKKREKPYEVALAEGWKTVDKGSWVMHVPPSFPVGLDIYEMGTYSAEKTVSGKEFFQKVRADVALEWACRVVPDAEPKDLKPSKVGPYEALFFDSMIPSQLGKDIRWRQWVFVEGNRCYFVVSTILPEFEDKIFPDVEKMLASFRLKQPDSK